MLEQFLKDWEGPHAEAGQKCERKERLLQTDQNSCSLSPCATMGGGVNLSLRRRGKWGKGVLVQSLFLTIMPYF